MSTLTVITKVCYKCKLDLPLIAFSKDSSKEDSKSVKCRECTKLYWKENKHRLYSNKLSNPEINITDEDKVNQQRKQFLISMLQFKVSSTRLP